MRKFVIGTGADDAGTFWDTIVAKDKDDYEEIEVIK